MYELLEQYFKAKTPISTVTFDQIKKYFVQKTYRKRELILQPGEICKYFYFVNKGCLRFYTINQEGMEFTRYFAFEGKFGTALTSFIEGSPSFEYIQSIDHTDLMVISRKDFYYLVENYPEINSIYKNILEMAYVTSQKRIYGLQGDTALERLKWLMKYQPKILSKLSNKVIASYLGVTPYTLSRLKSEL